MLHALRSNHYSIPLITFLILAILQGMNWIYPAAPTEVFAIKTLPLHEWFEAIIPARSATDKIVTTLLVLAQTLLIMVWTQKFNLVPRAPYLPGLIYVVVSGSFPQAQFFNPALLFGLILSATLMHTMTSFQQAINPFHSVSAAMILVLTGLFYPWALAYLLIIAVILIRQPHSSWRGLSALITGIFLPVFLTWSLLFLADQPMDVILNNFRFDLHTQPEFPEWPWSVWGLLGFMVLLILHSLVTVLPRMQTEKIIIRKGYSIMTLTVLLTLGLFLAVPGYHPELYWIAAVPVSFLFSWLFSFIASKKWAHILLYTWLALILWVHTDYVFFK